MLCRFFGVVLFVISAAAYGSGTYQCFDDAKNIRNVAIAGSVMTVVNPKTPRVVFSKDSDRETRENITRYENDAWSFYEQEGMASLTNKVFGDKYGCIQTGQNAGK